MLPSLSASYIGKRNRLIVFKRAKDWLTANIAPNAAEALETQHSISEFEQSLRNGYAIAHLARKLGGYADRICNVGSL